MKTVFIINPKAGQGQDVEALSEEILQTAKALQADVQIYRTEGVGDATRFVKEYCDTYGGARFIACGGDGTLSEVVSGIDGVHHAEVGVMPLGTGNDFCRNYADCDFKDIALQITAKTRLCDVICYQTELDGGTRTGRFINMCNIGFDCNVADLVADLKKKPFISGSLAYVLSILINLIKKKGADVTIIKDGETLHSGALLLHSVANGRFCGGGIQSNPLASVCDGTINFNIIHNVSRLRFLRLLPHYMKGTHITLSGIEDVIETHTCQHLTVIPGSLPFRICLDGEVMDAGKTEFKIMPGGVRFVVPEVLKSLDNPEAL